MHKSLAKNGLSHIHQIIHDIHDPLPKIEDYKIDYPCFVKPLAGSSSIGTNSINNYSELENYFKHSAKYNNKHQNEQNKNKFLIAEYIEGQEFIVDTFSICGIHYISTIQKYYKETYNGHPIPYYVDIENDLNTKENVTSYVKNVLNATEYQNGLAHIELFILPSGEIKLIEINARVSGGSGIVNKMSLLNGGIDQVGLLAKHVFNYNLITSNIKQFKYIRHVLLYNFSKKPLYNLNGNLSKYKTFCEVLQLVPDGHIIVSSLDLTISDTATFVILCSNDIKSMENDTKSIMDQDKTGWH